MSYTTADLIASVRRRASLPNSQDLFSEQDLIDFANDEMANSLITTIMSAREDYFVADYDYSVVAGQSDYTIPTRAIGSKLRDVQLLYSGTIRSLPRLALEDRTSTTTGPLGFYLKANKVQLSPTPTASTDTLRLVHFRRPGLLTLTTSAGQVTDIDTDLNNVTVSLAPTSFTNGTEVDFIKQTSGFECIAIDQEIVSISGSVINFASIPSELAVGDWITIAGESPIPQIPLELFQTLVQCVVVRVLDSMGDPKVEPAIKQRDAMLETALNLISPRVDGAPKKFLSKPLLRR